VVKESSELYCLCMEALLFCPKTCRQKKRTLKNSKRGYLFACIMKDFTLNAYRLYLQAIKSSYPNFFRFDDYLKADPKPETFCLIRHDVDRKPKSALKMALLENSLSVRSTYYFRTKPHTFRAEIIREIYEKGHEIGYHYESLSDSKGDMRRALKDFKGNLARLRAIAPVRTIAMHGRPFSPFDNRDMWRDSADHKRIMEELGILGEVYLDIDYSDIAYINDTGRNWSSMQSNIRDHVESNVLRDFASGSQLLQYIGSQRDPKIVLQIHPERWTDSVRGYYVQWATEWGINRLKDLFGKS